MFARHRLTVYVRAISVLSPVNAGLTFMKNFMQVKSLWRITLVAGLSSALMVFCHASYWLRLARHGRREQYP